MSQQDHANLQESLKNLSLTKSEYYKGRDGYNVKRNTAGLDSYYAVNAPAPGTVGVASARVNKSYTKANDNIGYENPVVSVAYQQQYYANVHDYPSANPSGISLHHANHHNSARAIYANVQSPSSHNYSSYGDDEEFPPPPTEDIGTLCSPPSPVSSSYAELRRTTHPLSQVSAHNLQNASMLAAATETYHPLSQTSSTYESIYEPIGSRSPSQMSKLRGYHGPYASPLAKGLAPSPSNQPILNPDKVGKEAEVDALTNLLVQSMDRSADPEFFGICSRCGGKVVGEGSGCTAMEQVFHIECFCCIVCLLKLQGKPFYALDLKPYCEHCYLNTLEKCCVCTKPILDRILRATGKPYHPGCFTCVVCQKSLDGIPFTVDASNQIHCIEDFHKKFAPRCSVCDDPIMPDNGQDETVRVVALDRSFHVNCYKCEDCGLVLSSEAEGRGCYPLDNHVLCKSCNARRVQALTSKVTTEL